MGHAPAAASPSSSTRLQAPPSPWQSPVPYLFGGLAAMLGLIALSLLALACSYWKLSGSLLAAGDPEDAERQGGTGSRRGDGDGKAAAAGQAGLAGDRWREHVVVIMAGDERPTFLATPASGRGVDDDVAVDVGYGGGCEEGRRQCSYPGPFSLSAGLQMQGDVVKLRKALMALLDNVEKACAAIRAVVTANLVSEDEEVDTTLLYIDNLAFDLGNLALECREAVPPQDEAVAAEWDILSTPSPPMTLEEHCEWWGMNYDSDQSRGIN
ncbi:hypothetical protein BAE44_0010813 [Dichanthelium oligosanthes]|uniref:Uncharacterized protein n=1 Tax=Dichanthelium oligosanthes TaxID=888268 RepID=A0A1E5VSR2_9POAL|nr:hypothetical protein BAE44_0010813 [Dichanthelium oligosanthes]